MGWWRRKGWGMAVESSCLVAGLHTYYNEKPAMGEARSDPEQTPSESPVRIASFSRLHEAGIAQVIAVSTA